MALSGSVRTSAYDGRYYQVDWTASQSIENNQSTITWTLKAMTDGWWAERTLNVVIGGTTVYSKTDRVERWDGTIASGTKVITHNTDGTASFGISIQAAVYYSTVNCTGSDTFTLNTIPRASSLSAGNGTLGTAQTLTISRASSGFRHILSASCGDYSVKILDDRGASSGTTSKSWTPPISWAAVNTRGTSVTVTLSLLTYSGSTHIGSAYKTITCNIPSSVKPTISDITITDFNGYADTYGAYVQGKSRLRIALTPTLAYGSYIKSYKVIADGKTYGQATSVTDTITSGEDLTVTATVTDERGRTSATATKSVPVLAYSAPLISLLKVKRCVSLEDGTEDINGEFAQVTFSAAVTPLNNLNTAKYTLEYKKTSDEEYTAVELTDYADQYEVTEGVYRFEADSGSSYNVRLVVTDNFGDIPKPTPLSTGEVIEHWRADGKGMGFGKIGEVENGADFGYVIKPNNGFINIPLEENTDLNDVIAPNTYVSYDKVADTYLNLPEGMTGGTFTLEVASAGNEGQIKQTITRTSKTNLQIWVRHYHSTNSVFSWGDWHIVHCSWQDCTVTAGSKMNFYNNEVTAQYRYDDEYVEIRIRGTLVSSAAISEGDTMFTISGIPFENNGAYAPVWDDSGKVFVALSYEGKTGNVILGSTSLATNHWLSGTTLNFICQRL